MAAGASASPGPLSSPGGSHVPCYAKVQFPVQSSKFPASILREFGGNTLNLLANARAGSPSPASSGKFPCIFPRNREFPDGDGFAYDCLHRQLVYCFCREKFRQGIVANYPEVSVRKLATTDSREPNLGAVLISG